MNTVDSSGVGQVQTTDTTRDLQSNPSSNDGQIIAMSEADHQQIIEAYEQIGISVVHTSLMMMFPEARRIQQRAENFNKQMLAE